jgi:hypothetical protein
MMYESTWNNEGEDSMGFAAHHGAYICVQQQNIGAIRPTKQYG